MLRITFKSFFLANIRDKYETLTAQLVYSIVLSFFIFICQCKVEHFHIHYNKQTAKKKRLKHFQTLKKKDFSAQKTKTRAQFNVFSATNSAHSAYA